MKKFVFAALCTVSLVSYVVAEDITAVITKVENSKITYFKTEAPTGGKKAGGKGKKGAGGALEKKGDAITGTAVAGVKVVKAGGKGKVGDPLEGGLANDLFATIPDPGIRVTLTIADDGLDKGNITQITIIGLSNDKGGKGKKGGN